MFWRSSFTTSGVTDSDQTSPRSGRFVQKIKTEKLPESQRELDVLSVDSSSSDESSGDTSSSSDEEASESANCGRMVKAPANPHGTKLVEHQKSNCVHLVSEGCSHRSVVRHYHFP